MPFLSIQTLAPCLSFFYQNDLLQPEYKWYCKRYMNVCLCIVEIWLIFWLFISFGGGVIYDGGGKCHEAFKHSSRSILIFFGSRLFNSSYRMKKLGASKAENLLSNRAKTFQRLYGGVRALTCLSNLI